MTKRQPKQPVVVEQAVSRETIAAAAELAGGDRRRVRLNRDGTATVVNQPRPMSDRWP